MSVIPTPKYRQSKIHLNAKMDWKWNYLKPFAPQNISKIQKIIPCKIKISKIQDLFLNNQPKK